MHFQITAADAASLLARTGQKLLKKMTALANDIFDTSDHSWVDRKQNFFLSVRLPGGAAIIFSKNWNFSTKKIVQAQFF